MRPTVRQHYVPACYLARFTTDGKRDSPFFVHSFDGPIRKDIPGNVGFERHYHTVDIPGLAPDHLEQDFQKFEGPACALFRTLASNPGRPFVTADECETAIGFLVTQAARVPQAKRTYENMIIDEGRTFMNKVAFSREFFEEVVGSAVRHGVVEGPVEQESLREAVESGDLTVVADKTHIAVGLFRLASGISDAIEGMNWTLWYSADPDWFVCSDYPVGLFYSVSGNATDPIVRLLPDFNTVYMPIARNVALVLHQIENVPLVQAATRDMVAVVNTITVSHAERFICSATVDFTCKLPDGQLGNAAETMETLKSFRQPTQ